MEPGSDCGAVIGDRCPNAHLASFLRGAHRCDHIACAVAVHADPPEQAQVVGVGWDDGRARLGRPVGYAGLSQDLPVPLQVGRAIAASQGP